MHKYIYVTPFFPSPNNWRGTYCYDFVVALKKVNLYDVIVFVPGDGSDYIYHGIRVHTFRSFRFPFGLFPYLLARLNQHNFVRKVKSVICDLDDVRFCHANINEFSIYALALKRIIPGLFTIVHHHNCEPIKIEAGRFGMIPAYTDLMYLWQKHNAERIDLHVFCSEKSRSTYGKCSHGVVENEWIDIRKKCLLGRILPKLELPRSVVVYNGYDKDVFKRESTSHEGFVIGCVANFQPLKDHLTLLKAIKFLKPLIPSLKVRLVGSGVMLPHCMKYVKDHGMSDIVFFEREMDHSQLPTFYRGIDLFVLPSRLEGFGCVYIEAWAMGVPFIACEGISCAEVLKEGERALWTARPHDVESLYHKILEYYHNRKQQHLTRDMDWGSIVTEYMRQLLDETSILQNEK